MKKSSLERIKILWAEIKGKEQEYERLIDNQKKIEQEKKDISAFIQNRLWQIDNLYEKEPFIEPDAIDLREHLEANMTPFVINAKNYAIKCHSEMIAEMEELLNIKK